MTGRLFIIPIRHQAHEVKKITEEGAQLMKTLNCYDVLCIRQPICRHMNEISGVKIYDKTQIAVKYEVS